MFKVPSRGSDQFALRFPDGMRARIRDAAEKNGRSMNSEILARLEPPVSSAATLHAHIAVEIDEYIQLEVKRRLALIANQIKEGE